jgi:hypothetical protein
MLTFITHWGYICELPPLGMFLHYYSVKMMNMHYWTCSVINYHLQNMLYLCEDGIGQEHFLCQRHVMKKTSFWRKWIFLLASIAFRTRKASRVMRTESASVAFQSWTLYSSMLDMDDDNGTLPQMCLKVVGTMK